MLPIEIVRKVMLYNVHPLAEVMNKYIIDHIENENYYLQEFGNPLNESFIEYIRLVMFYRIYSH